MAVAVVARGLRVSQLWAGREWRRLTYDRVRLSKREPRPYPRWGWSCGWGVGRPGICGQGEAGKQWRSKVSSKRNWIRNKQQIMESRQVSFGAWEILGCNDAPSVSSAQTQPAHLIRPLLWKAALPECLTLLVFSGNPWCFWPKGTRFLWVCFSQGSIYISDQTFEFKILRVTQMGF